MRQLILIIPLLSLGLSFAKAQTVWPGDVNNNGVVNAVDVLYHAQAFGASGPSRSTISTDWSAQTAPMSWGSFLSNGLDAYYADCNGDGEVDEEDLEDAITSNFSQTHLAVTTAEFSNASMGTAPVLDLRPSNSIVEEGDDIIFEVFLGDTDATLDDITGFAAQISYASAQGSTLQEPEFDTEDNNWLDPDDDASQVFFRQDGNGRIDLAISRFNSIGIPNGGGKVGEISIIMEDIIVGIAIDTLEIIVDSVVVFNGNNAIIPVVPGQARTLIAEDPSTVITTPIETTLAQVYPNPAGDQIFVQLPSPIDSWTLVNVQGQQILSGLGNNTSTQQINWGYDLIPGLYFLQITDSYGSRYLEKITIR